MPRLIRLFWAMAPVAPWFIWFAFPALEGAPSGLPETESGFSDTYRLPKAEGVGSTSCAAASCHGGTAGREGGEYGTWSGQASGTAHRRDPHSRAFQVLYNDVSRNIVRNLAGGETAKVIPAYQQNLCLKCHAVPIDSAAAGDHAAIARTQLVDASVGCEACHGPAQLYLAEHYLPSFQRLSSKEKAERYGLYPTKDLAFRVQLCSSCHVGAADREVNHDLIAAGHPRLMFEYASFQHHPKYQAHWTEKAYGADFDTKAWVIGQVAAARAAVVLLLARAERAEMKAAPWPELSEFSCYACHKDLGPAEATWKDLNVSRHRPGAMPWGTWIMPTLSAISKMGGGFGKDGPPALQALDELRRTMEKPSVIRDEVVKEGTNALDKLDVWLHALRRQPASQPIDPSGALYKLLAENALTADQKFNDLDWDGAVQHYLGLAALSYASGAKDPRQERALEQLRESLSFSGRYNSPHGNRATDILNGFQAIRKQTQEGKAHP